MNYSNLDFFYAVNLSQSTGVPDYLNSPFAFKLVLRSQTFRLTAEGLE